MKKIFLAAIFLVSFSPIANAVIIYSDRTTFNSNTNSVQTVDFESSFSFSNTSLTFGDATFISTDGSGLHRTVSGTFGGTTTRLAAQNYGGIEIQLGSGYNALGLDVGELFSGSSTGSFSLYDISDNLISTVVMDIGYFGPTPDFIGWTNQTSIGRLEFFATGNNNFETIDNVTLGTTLQTPNPNRIPEPSTLALLALGVFGFARKMKA